MAEKLRAALSLPTIYSVGINTVGSTHTAQWISKLNIHPSYDEDLMIPISKRLEDKPASPNCLSILQLLSVPDTILADQLHYLPCKPSSAFHLSYY